MICLRQLNAIGAEQFNIGVDVNILKGISILG